MHAATDLFSVMKVPVVSGVIGEVTRPGVAAMDWTIINWGMYQAQ